MTVGIGKLHAGITDGDKHRAGVAVVVLGQQGDSDLQAQQVNISRFAFTQQFHFQNAQIQTGQINVLQILDEQSCQQRVDNKGDGLHQRRAGFHTDKEVPVRPADKAACDLIAGHLL